MSEEVNEGVGLFTDDLFPWMQLGMGGGEPELDTPGNAEMQKWGEVEITPEIDQWLRIIELVELSGVPNKDGCRIRVNNTSNFELLESLLQNYWDREVIDYLRFGWPIDRDCSCALELGGRIHKGATEFESDIDQYIEKEVALGAMIGPFEKIPFAGSVPVAVSPLSLRPKKDSDARRVILDCSWPLRVSLNDGIDKDWYRGKFTNLKYPTIDMAARRIFDLSQLNPDEPIYMYKEDMEIGFRQLRACPWDVPLLGCRWRGQYYFDLVMVMGCRIAPYICQRTTSMLAYIHQQLEYFLLNYVDDFLGIEFRSRVEAAHSMLVRLMNDIGVQRLVKKSVPPMQELDFVGTLVNSSAMTLGVTPQQKIDTLRELEKWQTWKTCNRRQLESLVGKLQFISSCVRPGRLFVSRMLVHMKGMDRSKYYVVSEEMRKDIKWWYTFLSGFSGTSILWLLDVEQVDSEMSMDACLVGLGGMAGNEYFRMQFPRHLRSRSIKITHLELWAVIVSVRLWGAANRGKYIRIRIDNEAVSQIINTGRSADLMLQKQLRELTWWLAQYKFRIKGVHLTGQLNRIPDLLSRWHEGRHIEHKFTSLGGNSMCRKWVPQSYLQFTHDW